jgi:RimJ/RimL family protein N-acetyltransferase
MIRRLDEGDAPAYAALRREMLVDAPLAFASSPDDDMFSTLESTREQLRRAPEAVIFGAFDPELVGAVGLYRDRHLKSSHKAHLWGMYVVPARRGRGVGAELLAAVLRHARELPGIRCIHLGVSSEAAAARKLYERCGFQTWGTEADALRHQGRSADEEHMVLRLDEGASG